MSSETSRQASLLSLPCPNCEVRLRVPPQLAGAQIRCLACRTVLAVSAAADDCAIGATPVALVPASATRPCPSCCDPLHLVPQLEGCEIRCRGCRAVLGVSTSPWRLRLVQTPAEAQPRVGKTGKKRQADVPVQDTTSRTVEKPVPNRSPAPPPAEARRPTVREIDQADEPQRGIGEAEILEALGIDADESERGQRDRWEALEPPSAELTTLPWGGDSPEVADEPAVRKTDESASQKELLKIDKGANHHARVLTTRRSRSPLVLKVAVAAAGVAFLAVGVWWLAVVLGLGPVHPEARYLPTRCSWFASMDWQALDAAAGAGDEDLPGQELVRRCRLFLKNAGIAGQSVQRINAGRPAGEAGLMLVYRLAEPIDHEKLMASDVFHRYERKDVGSIPVYTLGTSSIAFPEERLIVNGDTGLLRRTLGQFRVGFRRSPCELLETVDFSAADVEIHDRIPATLVDACLKDCGYLAASARGTVDSFTYGKKPEFHRVIHAADASRAVQIQQALSASIVQEASEVETPESVRRLLESVEISQDGPLVRLDLTLESRSLPPEVVETLQRLFCS